MTRWRFKATVVLAAISAATFLSTAGTARAIPVHQAAASHSSEKVPKRNPFTGLYTKNYLVGPGGYDYFAWQYQANYEYCVYDYDGEGLAGSVAELSRCSAVTGSGEYWADPIWTSGPWIAFSELKNWGGGCLDDPGGGDNIQLTIEPCAAVGGQAWLDVDDGTFNDSGIAWENGIKIHAGKQPYEVVTLDYGAVKNGAWIVSNKYVADQTDQVWCSTGGCP